MSAADESGAASGPKKRKHLSGAAKKRQRKAREEAERAAAILAQRTGGGILPPPAELADAAYFHSWTLTLIAREIVSLYSDPSLSPAERRRALAELVRAGGLVSQKAELELKVQKMEGLVNNSVDALSTTRAELERDARAGRGTPS